MRQLLPIVVLLFLGNIKAWSQDHYDPKNTLTGEELFLKQGSSSRVIATPGQKYLVLDASPFIGGFHRYRFFPGDNIKFRMKNETIRFNETISAVDDTGFTFGVVNEAVGRMDYQRIPFVSQAAPLLPLAGLIFIGADFFNKGVDNKRYTTDTSTLVIGGSLMAAGYICYKFTFASLKINSRNKLKVLETY